MSCVNLKQLELTNIYKGNQKKDALWAADLMSTLEIITKSSCCETLETLGLANNFFEDYTLELIVTRILPKLKLKFIDISANKLTD
jgi:Leucine-rich repeat (LRR) protein